MFFTNDNLSPSSARLISGVIITFGINYWQVQISQANRQQDLKINQENNEEEILQKYLEGIEKLLLDYELNDDDEKNLLGNIARFKTLTILRRLKFNPELNKAIILQFLYDTKLIKIQNDNKNLSKLSLVLCDFKEVVLPKVNLSKANLSEANLHNSYLSEADLHNSYLSKAILSNANLSIANLYKANLSGSILFGADLSNANLYKANLNKAILRLADLSEAILYQAQSLNVKQLKSAKNWDTAIYTEVEWDTNESEWIIIDQKANKAKIQEIRDLTEGIIQF